jgi:quaternary ammonium compound-resistance protein SugE
LGRSGRNATSAFLFLLGRSLQVLPVGTAYAVRTGIGAVGTVFIGVVRFGKASMHCASCAALIVIGIVGFKLQAR